VSTGSKDGAFLADAKLAGGVDPNGNEHPLNCDDTGTLMVTGVVDVLPGAIFEITGEVEIKNDSGNPIPVTGTLTTTPSGTQTVAISQTGTDNDVNVTGTVAVSNFPAAVEISNDVGNPIPVSGSLTTTPSGTQDVNIISSVALPVTDNGGSLTVDGTFFQATQPVSGTVAVSNFPATQPVSGPLTDTQLRATPVAISGSFTPSGTQDVNIISTVPVPVTDNGGSLTVDGTFFQATQPVSGTVAVSNFPASQPVTGTFFQATQPVSLAVAPTTPVTGTFWQATQPVSGTFFQGTQPVSLAVAPTTPVTGTFFQATQPLSIAATLVTQEIRANTPAQSSVSVLTSNTSILATNAARLGATIYNESGATCFIKLGATASTTSYSIQMVVGSYYEVPFNYTGAIDGITLAITAILRVTELTV